MSDAPDPTPATTPSPLPEPTMPARLVAEFIGTFALVFAGCGAMVANDITGGAVGHAAVGLTWGLIVMAIIYAVGDISGAHLNPAVTTAFWVAKRIPGRAAALYAVTQFAAAIVAAVALAVIFPVAQGSDLGSTIPHPGINFAQLFLLELLLTFGLMTVILGVSTGAKEKGITAAIAVGATVGLMALFAGPICRASMNPARSLGPAFVSVDSLALASLWVYLLATTLGAILAVPVYAFMSNRETPS
ncbi:MAG: aquaporin [Planctomycetota bacterium]